MERFHSLSIDVARRHAPWVVDRLAEAGFHSFEERGSPGGRRRYIVYDTDVERLVSVRQSLRDAAGLRLERPALRFSIGEVATRWALEWTKYLEPVRLTEALTLYPNAPSGAPGPGELYVEPAFAFGFGEHASTRLAARWVSESCSRRPGCSVLDVGCGTGVLALVARKTGGGRALGVDLSEDAIAAARSNAVLNHLNDVSFECTPLAEVDGLFDVVVANIEAPVLCALATQIVEKLSPAGRVGLAGLIVEQRERVQRRYAELGIELELRDRHEQWCLLAGARSF